MKGRPLCKHGDHDDGTPWCEDAKSALVSRLDLIRVRLGADFETHGGKKVMYVGNPLHSMLTPMVPYGTLGTVESTNKSGWVMVKWDWTTERGMPNPLYLHAWDELEVLKAADDGTVTQKELERARMKTVPRVLSLALSCPFCLGRKISLLEDHGYWRAYCDADCHAGGPVISIQFPGLMALAVWNIRGTSEALSKEARGFPEGDVEVTPVVSVRDVKDARCPWCLGPELRVSYCKASQLYHGHCGACAAFSPWWPYENRERRLERFDKSVDMVIRGWRKRREVTHEIGKR